MAESVTSAQMAMEESAKSFRDLVEGSIQGVCIHSDSKILFVNPAMAHIFGYDDSDAVLAVGNIRALLATDEHERLAGYTLARNAGEDVPDIYEAKGVKKDGSTIWVEFRVTPVLWHGLSALQSVIVDITDRKKAEKELIHHRDHLQDMVDEATRELNLRAAELREALAKEKELNELQRQFVAITSHEFRTPLAIIDSAAQLLKRGAGSLKPGETLDKVERIRGAVQRMTQLMEKTLTAAKMEDGQISVNIRSCNIERIIKDVCALQQQMAKSHVISCHLSDLPETIKADSSALEQVLANLLSNAVKFAPDACDIEINASRDGDDVVISVRDQGLGIDDADLPRIFSRYFRAKTAAGIAGTGIGLNLVKALIEMHGGSVGVESKAGEGSNFTVRLPIGGPARAESDDTIAA
jgi:PAS domain S-box-containing protein